MDISSAIVGSAMEMSAMQTAAQYSTGVMKMEMEAMEDISALLVQQMASLSVGSGGMQSIDLAV